MTRRQLPHRVRWVWWCVVLGLATVAVWQRYAVVQLGADVRVLQVRVSELTRVRNHLLTEIGSLAARERIERIATERFGLQPTAPEQRRTLAVALQNDDRGFGEHFVAEVASDMMIEKRGPN